MPHCQNQAVVCIDLPELEHKQWRKATRLTTMWKPKTLKVERSPSYKNGFGFMGLRWPGQLGRGAGCSSGKCETRESWDSSRKRCTWEGGDYKTSYWKIVYADRDSPWSKKTVKLWTKDLSRLPRLTSKENYVVLEVVTFARTKTCTVSGSLKFTNFSKMATFKTSNFVKL